MKRNNQPSALPPITQYSFDHFAMRKFLASLSPEKLREFYTDLQTKDPYQFRELIGSPIITLSEQQLKALTAEQKFIWLIGGRNFGKSHTASCWILDRILRGDRKILFYGPTWSDQQDTQIVPFREICERYGLTVHVSTTDKAAYIEQIPDVRISIVSAEGEYRGPNLHCGWSDEFINHAGGRPKIAEERYSIAMEVVRTQAPGSERLPQVVNSTTPKAFPYLKKLFDQTEGLTKPTKYIFPIVGTIFDNPSAIPSEVERIREILKNPTLKDRQEYLGEVIWEANNPLFREEWIRHIEPNETRANMPLCRRIVIAVDPATTAKRGSDLTGIIVAGELFHGNEYVILADHSGKYTPNEWAAKVSALYHQYKANAVIVERNQGGDMVKSNLTNYDYSLYVETVHATVGKITRAEPVSALYEARKIVHYGRLPKLESQMLMMESGGESPDRVDAMVYAILYFINKKPIKRDLSWFPEH